MRTKPQTPAGPLHRALAWGLLLVLLAGYLRVFVICSGPHCESDLELVHSSSSCCASEHEMHHAPLGRVCDSADSAPGDHGECGREHGDHEQEGTDPLLSNAHVGCSDVSLSAAVGPLPSSVHFDLSALKRSTTLPRIRLDFAVAEVSRGARGTRPEPARSEQVGRLLATTILRI